GDGNGILMTDGENGRIVNTELHKEANKSYMSYAMSVLLGRRCKVMLELRTLDGVLTTRPPWRWLDDQFGLLDYKNAQLVKEALKYGSGATPIHDGMRTPMHDSMEFIHTNESTKVIAFF
ncbi:hypothetical protein Tco_0898323, partial [Tanacetum coccineum]